MNHWSKNIWKSRIIILKRFRFHPRTSDKHAFRQVSFSRSRFILFDKGRMKFRANVDKKRYPGTDIKSAQLSHATRGYSLCFGEWVAATCQLRYRTRHCMEIHLVSQNCKNIAIYFEINFDLPFCLLCACVFYVVWSD